MSRGAHATLLATLCLLFGTAIPIPPGAAWAEEWNDPRGQDVVSGEVAFPDPSPTHTGSTRQTSHFPQPENLALPQPTPAGVPVDDLVGYALANNPEIQAARYKARALGARVPQVRSLPDPQLTTVTFLESIETAAGPQEVVLSLSQRFPWFGKLPLRSQVAYHDAMAAYARLTAVELRVIEQVKRAYYDVYFLKRAIEVTESLKPRLEETIRIAQSKVVGGAGLESVWQARVELSNLKTRLVDLSSMKAEAQARLAAVLHISPYTRIEPVDRITRTRIANTARLLVALAESWQPELDARRREISRDRASVDLACREYWPDVTLGFNWYEVGSPGLSPVTTGEDSFSIGVGVNLPIYRSRLDAAVREAQYKTAQSARQYAATLDQVHAEVQALYAQFEKHDGVLQILADEIVPDAKRTFDLSVEAFRVGRIGFQQLIDNYDSLLKYQIEYYKREALREQVIASLERAVGSAVTGWPADGEGSLEPIPLPPPQRQPAR